MAVKRARVRPVSRNVGSNRIRNLKCYQEVYEKVTDGWSLPSVADFIQGIRKEATEISRESLVALLVTYRNSLPPAELTKKRMTSSFVKAVAQVEDGLDELAELERLYKLQMHRIEIDFNTEKSIKKLMSTTGQEVRIAKEILTSYADLKMDLGLSKRHIGQMQVDARVLADVAVRYNKPEVQTVLDNAQSRKKILGLVERLLSRPTAGLAELQNPSPEVIEVEGSQSSDDITEVPRSPSDEAGDESIVKREELFPEDILDEEDNSEETDGGNE